jgi:DNA-binding response OmpR family regulator
VDQPLVVCVSADAGVRERVVRQLDSCGVVLICTDLDDLRQLFFPGAPQFAPPAGAEESDGPPRLRAGDLVIDPTEHRVTWQGRPLPLTRLERELLAGLASSPDSVRTYEQLFSAAWGSTYMRDTSVLHSAMKRLRRKLRSVPGDITVETVRGVGYRLVIG